MRGIKLEKSHIHILESKTLRRESKVTESAQEIVRFNPLYWLNIDQCLPNVNAFIFFVGGMFYKKVGILLGGCLTSDAIIGENGAELLVSAIRSRRSISGPELTK